MRRFGVVALVGLVACRFHPGAEMGAIDAAADASDASPDAAAATGPCAPMQPPVGATEVGDVAALTTALANAPAGSTIALDPGTYAITVPLAIATTGITLMSKTGDRTSVVLDGGGTTTPIVEITASGVTLASLTIAHSATVGAFVTPANTAALTGDRIYDVVFDDDVGPAVRVYSANPAELTTGPYADDGEIGCSQFQDTTAVDHCTPGQLGIDGVAIRGWTIHDNAFDHVACPTQFVRAIWIRGGSRDVQLLNNRMLDSNGNITLGDDPSTTNARTYSDALPTTCSGLGGEPPQFWGGVACNNAIAGLGAPMYTANDFFDDGLSLWGACETWALHNTVVSPPMPGTYHAAEYRFDGTFVHFVNNLLEQVPIGRDSGAQDATYSASNLVYSGTTDFVDATNGDLHLTASAPETAGVSIATLDMCQTDAQGKPRDLAAPMVGAYER